MGGVAPELGDEAVFPVEIGLHRLGGVVGAFIGAAIDIVECRKGSSVAICQGAGRPGRQPALQDQRPEAERREFGGGEAGLLAIGRNQHEGLFPGQVGGQILFQPGADDEMRAGDMAAPVSRARSEIEQGRLIRRQQFFQHVGRDRLRRRPERQRGAPGPVGLQGVVRHLVQHDGVPAHLRQPGGRHVGARAEIVEQHDASAPHRREMVGFLY